MKALIDLHTHTIASGHAFSTIKENIEEAVKKGLKILGTSDHYLDMPGTAHPYFFGNYKVLKDEIEAIRLLKGIEANIIDYDGSTDVDDDIISSLDYIIASLHPPCLKPSSIENNTNAVLKAMDNPYIKIIGHPDDGRFSLDYEAIVKHAKKTNTVLEVNNSSLRKNTTRVNSRENLKKILELCKIYEADVILGSDSHIYYDIGIFDEAYKLLSEIDFPESLIINCDLEKIDKVLIKNNINI